MRGKGTSLRNFKSDERITPAYAGKSFQLGDVPAVQKDHPRLCGEKFIMAMEKNKVKGSPPPMRGKGSYGYQTLSPCRDHPRLCGEKHTSCSVTGYRWGSPPPMRGKVSAVLTHADGLRITPAYAGKSSFTNFSNFIFQDHPRLCGEKFNHSKISAISEGSPPPMRGKALQISSCLPETGITPAYAGKSKSRK